MNIVKDVKIVNIIRLTLIIIGVILIADELHEFGIPFGPFLPDMSWFDSFFHHWMLGALLIVIALLLTVRVRRRQI